MRGFRTGLAFLESNCPDMRTAFTLYGKPKSRKRSPGFATLARIIVDQQVSVQAGAAIWRRLEGLLGEVTPTAVIDAGENGLREAGLSGAKARYIFGIAEKVQSQDIDLHGLSRYRNDVAREQLIALRGVGDWTADIYLMFAIGRPDIFPVGDIALQVAAGRLLGLEARPTPKQLGEIAERWSPYRTVASVALWHFYKKMPMRD